MFKVGDKVYCDSGHTGYEGQIVAVVPPHTPPGLVADRLVTPYRFECFFGKPRKSESYLVAVATGNKIMRLRWPKVDRLRVQA
jgi:hypothetical protein